MFLEAVGNVFPNGHTSEALSGTKKVCLKEEEALQQLPFFANLKVLVIRYTVFPC